ncbi:MAG TPA: MlaD family protein [Solirubrobacteraceae bacterium]|nr:MlaD family protein [Solirubrobacteraceae bacterium]
MRRLAILTALAAVALAAAVATLGGSAQGSASATFQVIFDDARGLVPGQLVKIAGAQAGTIQDVSLTPGFQARIRATVSSAFMPLHRDASCTIRPEGLIGENYVECDPGTPGSPPLRGVGDAPPTVPVGHTTEPVSLLDLFGIFNAPTRERLTVLLNELGVATSARGQDINAILRRANPALGAAQRVIGILERQRGQLATLVGATDVIARSGASHPRALQAFLDQSARLTALTARHRGPLGTAVARLPRLLAVTEPALRRLDTVAVQGTPLLGQLRAAAPALDRVATDLGPFAAAARPALARLGRAVGRTVPALRGAVPLLTTIRGYADRSKASTLLTGTLLPELQRRGFFENFLSVFYYIGAALAREDATSHLLSIAVLAPANGACGNYATTPVAGCSAHYGSARAYTPVSPRDNDASLQALLRYLLR